MTTLSKITVIISAAVICLSLGSLFFLYRAHPRHVVKTKHMYETMVRVAVLNGCGREGLAALCARKLRDEGFDVVNGLGENADSFDFDVSVIVDRKGNIQKARMLADRVGITAIVDQRSDNPYIIEDLVIILGRDWDTLPLFREEGKD
jgi:hypothetical protein